MGSPLTVRGVAGSLATVLLTGTPWILGITSTPADAAAPSPPAACTAAAIAADTGLTVRSGVVCSAGFAMALAEPVPGATEDPTATTAPGSSNAASSGTCERLDGCAEVDIFHTTMSGWVHDGRHGATCAEDLGVAFMSPQTAATFAPVCDEEAWAAPVVVRPGDESLAVVYVQIAALALGVEVAIDGTYDERAQAEIRRLQAANGIDPTGIVGPETHALLGTGPPASGVPTSTTTSTPTTLATTTTSVPPTDPTSTTSSAPRPSGVALGAPRPCTREAIAHDTGLPVEFVGGCHAGWALGLTATTCPATPDDPDAECETADAFHLEHTGWVHSGWHYPYCAESLAEGAGMSIHTALQWSPACGDAPVPGRVDIEAGSPDLDVRQVQIALVALGYPIEIDGEYGPQTEAAVRDVQQRHGLDVDGIAGPETQIVLGM